MKQNPFLVLSLLLVGISSSTCFQGLDALNEEEVDGDAVFLMAHLRSVGNRQECETVGEPYLIEQLSQFGQIVNPNATNPLKFFPGECGVFSLDPLRFIRVDENCGSFKIYNSLGCNNEFTEYNSCINPSSSTADKPNLPFYKLECVLHKPPEIVQLTIGCKRSVGVVRGYVSANACVSNGTHSSRIVSSLEGSVGLELHTNSGVCASSGDFVVRNNLDPQKCGDISDIAGEQGESSTEGLRASVFFGTSNIEPVSYGPVESIATTLVVITLVFGFSVSAFQGFGMDPMSGGPVILYLSHSITKIGQMNLPQAPKDYLNFATSFGWTTLSINILGGNVNFQQSSRRQLQNNSNQIGRPVNGFDAYLQRLGIPREEYFMDVIIIFLLLHVIAGSIILVAFKLKKKSIEDVKSYAKSASMIISYIMFYPLMAGILFEFWVVGVSGDEDAATTASTAFVSIASIALICLVIWLGSVAWECHKISLEKKESQEHRLVYGIFTRSYRYPFRNFWMANLASSTIDAMSLVFIRTTPFFAQPVIVLLNSFIMFSFIACFRPFDSKSVNRLSALIYVFFFTSTLIPVLWAIEPILFDDIIMNNLGKAELALGFISLALTAILTMLEAGPRIAKLLKRLIRGFNEDDNDNENHDAALVAKKDEENDKIVNTGSPKKYAKLKDEQNPAEASL